MNKNLFIVLAMLLSLTCIFTVAAYATETDEVAVYVKTGGGGTGASALDPASTFGTALKNVPAPTVLL